MLLTKCAKCPHGNSLTVIIEIIRSRNLSVFKTPCNASLVHLVAQAAVVFHALVQHVGRDVLLNFRLRSEHPLAFQALVFVRDRLVVRCGQQNRAIIILLLLLVVLFQGGGGGG